MTQRGTSGKRANLCQNHNFIHFPQTVSLQAMGVAQPVDTPATMQDAVSTRLHKSRPTGGGKRGRWAGRLSWPSLAKVDRSRALAAKAAKV